MSDPGFTVSPPDLDGFAARIGDTGGFYSTVGDDAFTLSVSSSAVRNMGNTTGRVGNDLANLINLAVCEEPDDSEPAGLTEEPDDGSSSDTARAAGRSHR